MDTWIITGGAGFIGSNLVRKALLEPDVRIVVVDDLTYAGNLQSLADVASNPRFQFIKANIADRTAVEVIFREHQPSAILNLAAESHVDRSILGPEAFIKTNVYGTFALLEAAKQAWSGDASTCRFLHISTDEVYGSLGPDDPAFTEKTPYAPNSPYAASKASSDHLVRAYHHTYGLPTLTTNCSNNYGPYQFPEKLIPLMILNALEGRPLPIYGDGGNVRDWLYVEDHCEGILLALESGRPGERYNIGGGNERTNLEMVDAICEALDGTCPAASNPRLTAAGVDDYKALKNFVQDRPGHDRRYAIDASKIRQELGWTPEHDFAAGMELTLRWYLNNREWCEAVQSESSYHGERLGLMSDNKQGQT